MLESAAAIRLGARRVDDEGKPRPVVAVAVVAVVVVESPPGRDRFSLSR